MKNVQKAAASWLDKIYEAKGYPTYLYIWGIVIKLRGSIFFSESPDKVLCISLGNEKPERLICEFSIRNWPDRNEYPANCCCGLG